MFLWVTLAGKNLKQLCFSSIPISFPVSSSDPVSSLCPRLGLFLNLAPTSGSHKPVTWKCVSTVLGKLRQESLKSLPSKPFLFHPTAIASPFLWVSKAFTVTLKPSSRSGVLFHFLLFVGPSTSCLWGARPYLEEDRPLPLDICGSEHETVCVLDYLYFTMS